MVMKCRNLTFLAPLHNCVPQILLDIKLSFPEYAEGKAGSGYLDKNDGCWCYFRCEERLLWLKTKLLIALPAKWKHEL